MKLIAIPKTGTSTFRHNMIANNHLIKFPISMDHETRYNPNEENITIVRNPVARTISHYNEVRNNTTKELKLINWFEERYYDYQTKWLIDKVLNKSELNEENFEELLSILKTFYWICLTEDLDQELPKLLNSMGLTKLVPNINVASKRYTPTESEKELILSKNKFDFRLYEFVRLLK